MSPRAATAPGHHPLHQRVCATPAAIDAIIRLRAKHGNLTLHHVDGDECEVEARGVKRPLVAGRTTVCAGIAGGAAFCVDRHQDAALGFPDYEVGVAPAPEKEEGERQPRLISRVVPGSARRS
jgi:uncharacterized protein (DUF779 family)